MIDRRSLLAAGAAALAAGRARAAGRPVRIGVLNDASGVFADYQGPGSVLATRLAIEDAGGQVAGRAIELVAGDHQNKPDVGMSIVRRWFDEGLADIVLDVPNSAIALAVAGLASERNKAFIGCGAGTSDLTGRACQPTTIQWDYDTWEVGHALGRAVTQRGGKTWFTLAADYVFGAELDRNVAEGVRGAGSTIVGGVKAPFPTSDFSSYLIQAQSSGAQVLALDNAGGDTTTSLKQAAEFGLTQSMQVCSPIYNINVTQGVGLAVAKGVMGVTPFYWDMSEGTRSFSRRYQSQQAQRAMPNDMQAACYSATLHVLKAVASGADPVDGRALVARMKAMPTDDALFGPGLIRADGRKLHPVYLFTTKSPAESQSAWDFYRILSTIPPDQAFRPMGEGGCPLIPS